MVFTFTDNSPCSWIKIYAVCYYLHRDALAKEIYTQLFGWLIGKVNNIIFKGKMQMSIAVLDIFGFEVSYVLRCKTCFDCWEAPLRDPLVGSIFCPVAFMTKMPWCGFYSRISWSTLDTERICSLSNSLATICVFQLHSTTIVCVFFHICLNSWTAKW